MVEYMGLFVYQQECNGVECHVRPCMLPEAGMPTCRLDSSHKAAEKYLQQFPSPALTHLANFVAFIAGSFAALLLFMTLMDDFLLERDLFGRHVVWSAAACHARPCDSHSYHRSQTWMSRRLPHALLQPLLQLLWFMNLLQHKSVLLSVCSTKSHQVNLQLW